jgi:hypothetical protein
VLADGFVIRRRWRVESFRGFSFAATLKQLLKCHCCAACGVVVFGSVLVVLINKLGVELGLRAQGALVLALVQGWPLSLRITHVSRWVACDRSVGEQEL